MKGTVKWFDSAKGYGFITTEAGSDIFVHYTGINKEGFRGLEEGQNVEFEVSEGKKGEQAVNVRGLDVGEDESTFRANIVPGSVKAPETWYSKWLDPLFGVE